MNTPFPVREDGKFTVEEYFALIESRPEEERWQLIDGVAMMMPPPTLVHERIALNLAFELNTHFRAHRSELCAYQEVILSDSNTDKKDIAVKRQRYLQHPDNLYFMLIEQKRVEVEPRRLLGK